VSAPRIHQHIASSFKEGGELVEYFKGDEVTDSRHIELLDKWEALEPVGSDEPEGDEFDRLFGDELDEAITEAGIDASTGGSLKDGSLSAAEKREALRKHAAEQS
jgi:hypothetical protein